MSQQQQRFEGPSLEAVLADVTERLGPDASIIEANRLRRGGIAGFFAKERYEVLADPGGAGPLAAPADPEAAEAVDAPVSTETPEFAAMLDALINQAGSEDGHVSRPAPEAPAVPPTPVSPVTMPAPLVPISTPEVLDEAPARDRGELVRLGLPEELLTSAAEAEHIDPARWIAGLLELAPRPARLPAGRGSVVTSVGPRDSALALARDLAAEMGLDPDDVVLASPGYRGRAVAAHRRLPDVETVDEQRRSWRRRPRPTVVAVEAGPGPAAAAHWGRRVLDVLEPTMIWASVQATRKPEDISAWAERLGGVGALSVTGVDETESPAAVLRCGVPVGRLDGRPATPALWGALLAQRLDTRW